MADLQPGQPSPAEGPPARSGSWFHWRLPQGDRITTALPALGYRDFRLFWLGQLVSLTGTWIQSVAQQWLVLKLTGSAFALGLVTTIQFTPLLVLSLLGGAIADRVSKRNLLLATQVSSGILALLLGTLVQSGAVRYWHVLVIAGGLGTINAFYTPARQSFVPELVNKESLLNAVALNSTIFNAARVLGPAVGGILIALLGLSLNFYLNAASYVAVIISLLLIRRRPPVRREEEPKTLWLNVVDGLKYIRATPVVYTILALVGFASLFAFNFTILIPLVARFVLHVGSDGYGFLMASMGFGSLVGALTLAFVTRRDLARRFIYAGAMIFCSLEIVLGFSRNYALSVALMILIGLSSVFFTTTANTRVLSLTPSHLQGRVMSVYSLMFLGMTPFGSILAGIIAERFGAPVALVGGGALTLAFTLVVLVVRSRPRSTAPVEVPSG